MGVISPIKDKDVIEKMKEYLRERNVRNYLLFRIGLNSGLPLGDLLGLRVEDVVRKEVISVGDYRIRISSSLQREIAFYIGNRESGYLFRLDRDKPLSRFQLYHILKDAAEAAGFKAAVSGMTLRKTFAYWAHKEQRVYLPLLSKYLNHHTVSHTLRFMEAEEKSLTPVCLAEMDL